VLTPTVFAPGGGSLSERLPVADAEVTLGDGRGSGVRTRTDADGRFTLALTGGHSSRGAALTVRIDGELVHEQEVVLGAEPSVTRLDLLVPMLPGARLLGGAIEQVGTGEPGTLEVEVLDDRGRPQTIARSGRGSPGDWRLQLALSEKAPPRSLTVVLLRDGRPVDSEHVAFGAAIGTASSWPCRRCSCRE
jgi:hypothetical protein